MEKPTVAGAEPESTPTEAGAVGAVPPRRPPGHRSTDARDTVAEMAARAHEISQEAGSRVGQAMKEVIFAAAGLVGFTVETARDVLQFMVRRGQMTQEEAEGVIRKAEEANAHRKPPASAPKAPAAEPHAAPSYVATPHAAEPEPAATEPARTAAPKPSAAKAARPSSGKSTSRKSEAAKPATSARAKKSAPTSRPKPASKSSSSRKKK